MFDSDTVVVLSLWVGGEQVVAVGGHFGVAGDDFGVSAAADEMVGDYLGLLLLVALVDALQDVGGAAVQAGAAGGGELFVEVVDEQGVPEVVGDARAGALLGEHAGFERLFEQVQDGVFVAAGGAGLHGADDVEFEVASQDGGLAEHALAGLGEAA